MKKHLILLFSFVFLLFGCDEADLNKTSDTNNESENVLVENNENNIAEESVNEQENIEVESENELPEDPGKAEDEGETEEEEDVPREYRNALRAAQNYIDLMPFSEKGLYEQLTSEYGDKYPEEAAQYAIDNLEVDYNEQALKAAISYQELMPMSDQELFDQLTSEYGDQYTEEQAQYAIDNLED